MKADEPKKTIEESNAASPRSSLTRLQGGPDPSPLAALTIHPKIFGLSRGSRCRLEECRAACCRNGVWMDLEHAERLLAQRADIAPHLPPERRDPFSWFDDETIDPDFPSGRGMGSACAPDPNDPEREVCVFLRPDYRCALQVASEALHLPYPGLKPYDCALYPVLLSEGELVLDEWSPAELSGADCQREIEGPPEPVITVFQGELLLALGPEGYEELCRAVRARREEGGGAEGRRGGGVEGAKDGFTG